jgi:hypothetical protein
MQLILGAQPRDGLDVVHNNTREPQAVVKAPKHVDKLTLNPTGPFPPRSTPLWFITHYSIHLERAIRSIHTYCAAQHVSQT